MRVGKSQSSDNFQRKAQCQLSKTLEINRHRKDSLTQVRFPKED